MALQTNRQTGLSPRPRDPPGPGPELRRDGERPPFLPVYPPELKLRFLRNGLAIGSGEIDMGPNGDGSFYAWSSLTVKSGDEHHYRCVVQHAGLAQPLTVELGEVLLGNCAPDFRLSFLPLLQQPFLSLTAFCPTAASSSKA